MKWTKNYSRETEWKDYFAWFPVAIEIINPFYLTVIDREVIYVWFEKIEKRKIALRNARTGIIYRRKGSSWDYRRQDRPEPPNQRSAGKPKPPKNRIMAEGF